jgi:hypothetical protein
MATVALRIRKIKNDIEENNSDVHRISGVWRGEDCRIAGLQDYREGRLLILIVFLILEFLETERDFYVTSQVLFSNWSKIFVWKKGCLSLNNCPDALKDFVSHSVEHAHFVFAFGDFSDVICL